jgi:hypothetical protein
MRIPDSVALGYIIGALWTALFAAGFELYKTWVWARSLREEKERLRDE